MNVPIDNMAGRLYTVINKLLDIKANNPYEAFSVVFNIDEESKNIIHQKYADLFNMATEGKSKIKQIDVKNHDKYITAFDVIMEGLSTIEFSNTTNGMLSFNNYFDSTKLIPLEFCAEFLSNYVNENMIDDDEIKLLLTEIEKIINEVLEMDINKELKYSCMYNLENIRESLLKYKLFGNEGLIKNMECTLGSIILNRHKAQNDEDRKTFTKITQFIGKINTILSLGNQTTNLLTSISEKLIK